MQHALGRGGSRTQASIEHEEVVSRCLSRRNQSGDQRGAQAICVGDVGARHVLRTTSTSRRRKIAMRGEGDCVDTTGWVLHCQYNEIVFLTQEGPHISSQNQWQIALQHNHFSYLKLM